MGKKEDEFYRVQNNGTNNSIETATEPDHADY